MADRKPRRGEVWRIDLEPVRGHEQGRRRPAVIVSADIFNEGPSQLVIICPMTSRERSVGSRVAVDAPEGGLHVRSFVICEQIRAVSTERLGPRLGELAPQTMAAIEGRLRILLDL